jgi:hypothetical protein
MEQVRAKPYRPSRAETNKCLALPGDVWFSEAELPLRGKQENKSAEFAVPANPANALTMYQGFNLALCHLRRRN